MAQANAYSSGSQSLTANTPTEVRVPIRNRFFLATSLTEEVAPTGRYTVSIGSMKRRQFLTQGGVIRDNLLLGNGNEPFYLFGGFLFYPDDEIIFQLDDLSGSTNTVHLAVHGRDLTIEEALEYIKQGKQHVSYSIAAQTITTNGGIANPVIRGRDRGWQVRALTLTNTSDFDLQVESSGRQGTLFAVPIRANSINGTPNRPYLLFGDGWRVEPRSQLISYITSRVGTSNTIAVAYHGEETLKVDYELARIEKLRVQPVTA